MDDDERYSVHEGREQKIDARRTLRVKIHHKWQAVTSSETSSEAYDRIFANPAEPKPPPVKEPDEVALAKRRYRDAFDAIRWAK